MVVISFFKIFINIATLKENLSLHLRTQFITIVSLMQLILLFGSRNQSIQRIESLPHRNSILWRFIILFKQGTKIYFCIMNVNTKKYCAYKLSVLTVYHFLCHRRMFNKINIFLKLLWECYTELFQQRNFQNFK